MEPANGSESVIESNNVLQELGVPPACPVCDAPMIGIKCSECNVEDFWLFVLDYEPSQPAERVSQPSLKKTKTEPEQQPSGQPQEEQGKIEEQRDKEQPGKIQMPSAESLCCQPMDIINYSQDKFKSGQKEKDEEWEEIVALIEWKGN